MPKDTKNTAIYVAFDDYDPFDGSSPERNLLSAVLMSAITDLKKDRETSQQALEYLLSAEEDYLFSFRSICNYLSVDPERVLLLAGLQGATQEASEEEKKNSERGTSANGTTARSAA